MADEGILRCVFSTLHYPTYSAGVCWSLQNSGGLHICDLCHILDSSESGGFQWIPADSGKVLTRQSDQCKKTYLWSSLGMLSYYYVHYLYDRTVPPTPSLISHPSLVS